MAAIPTLNHGLIGNGSLLALIAPTSAMEWLCLPRFDAPSVFARLLDARGGGVFRILSQGAEVAGEMGYLPNTNILRTRFRQGEASWELVDFAPRLPKDWGEEGPIRVIRLLRPTGGRVRLSIDFDPRLDYGRGPTRTVTGHDGIEVQGQGGPLFLQTNLPLCYIEAGREFTLDGPVHLCLSYGATPAMTMCRVLQELEQTTAGWERWSKTCGLPLFQPEMVLRSALCLKLHAYEDTGAIIAAATTSIPEAMGTGRTWDYRFCWLRDAAFVVEALRRIGHLREGERFLRYLRNVAEAGPLQPLYGIDGGLAAQEQELDHLAGFGGQGPVRIGNAAVLQRQHDLMLRYRNPDDFGAPTSAFTICSFWWAEALALAGRLEQAVEVFDRVCALANPVGLFSEDIDPRSGRLLGNFPQAYTHVGLINAAVTISELLEARDGKVRAWSSPGTSRWATAVMT